MSRFRRRLMGLAALRQAAADDFVRVEYIENTSTAYILPNYKTNANTIIEFDVQITTINVQARIIGNASGYFESYINGNKRFSFASNGSTYSSNVNANTQRHIFKLDNTISKGYIDNTEVKIAKNTSKYYNTIYLIARGEASNLKCKIYGCKIYNGDTLVRDFIPMYQKSKDLYGLWDRVEEKFYTSPNGVKFTGGERVIADANDNLYYLKDYISSNDSINAYITLRKFSNTDKIEFKIYKKRNNDSWFGSRASSPTRNHFAVNGYGGGINMNYGSNTPTRIVNNVANDMAHTIRVYDREVFLDGKKIYTCGTNTFTTNSNVTLGKVDGVNNLASNCNWYYFKWWNKDKDLIYDMIPVQRISDGVWGMFCKVHLGFYPSNGSAQFTGG